MGKGIEGLDEKIIASAKAEFLREGYLGASLRQIVVVKQNCYIWDGLIPACTLLRTESALHCMNVV